LGKQVPYVGKSTHSLAQAVRTVKEKVDYIGVGPVFKTPPKPTYEPVGLKLVSQVAQKIKKPFVAIGGIDANNISGVLEAGATRVAMVRALFGPSQVLKKTRAIKEQINHYLNTCETKR